MRRALKFRAWNGETMISPDYITRDGIAHWKENSIPTSSDKIMQFTGLHDKNGKEIYEGDILMYRNNMSVKNPGVPFDSYHKVCFGEYDFGEYEDQEDGYGWYKQDIDVENYGSSLTPISSDLYEVIGNIHENPELLK